MPIAEAAKKAIADLQAPAGRGVDALERRLFQRLQALEDAIAYRRARAAAPCPVCAAVPGQCDDHGPVLAGGPLDGGC